MEWSVVSSQWSAVICHLPSAVCHPPLSDAVLDNRQAIIDSKCLISIRRGRRKLTRRVRPFREFAATGAFFHGCACLD